MKKINRLEKIRKKCSHKPKKTKPKKAIKKANLDEKEISIMSDELDLSLCTNTIHSVEKNCMENDITTKKKSNPDAEAWALFSSILTANHEKTQNNIRENTVGFLDFYLTNVMGKSKQTVQHDCGHVCRESCKQLNGWSSRYCPYQCDAISIADVSAEMLRQRGIHFNKADYNPNIYLCTLGNIHDEEFCNGKTEDDKDENICPISKKVKQTIHVTPSVVMHSRVPVSSTKDNWNELVSGNTLGSVVCRSLEPSTLPVNPVQKKIKLRRKRAGTKTTEKDDDNSNVFLGQLLSTMDIRDPQTDLFKDYLLKLEPSNPVYNIIKMNNDILYDMFPGKKRFDVEADKLKAVLSKKITQAKRYMRSARPAILLDVYHILSFQPSLYKPILSYCGDGSEMKDILRNTLRIWTWSIEAGVQMSAMEVCLASIMTCKRGFKIHDRIVVPKNRTLAIRGFLLSQNQYRFYNISPGEFSESKRKFEFIVNRLIDLHDVEYVNFLNSNILDKVVFSFHDQPRLIKNSI